MPVSFKDNDTKRIEFGSRNDAGDIRDDLPEEALLESDDGREKTLKIDTSALDERTLRRVKGEAAVSRDDARGSMHGQESLTESEKKRLDFTEATVPEARTAKASLLAEGVSDWTAYFDPSLTTSEMADLARSTQASGGARMDSADTQRAQDRQAANMRREVQSQQAKRAREGCEDGFEDACDQLVEEHGFSRQEAESLLAGQPAQSGMGVTADGGLVTTTVLRAGAPGTFLQQPPEPAPDAPGYRNGSSGRFVGYEIDEYDNAKRSPESGQIKTLGDADPVPRDEAIDRWGRPDGIDGNPRDDAMRDALFEFEPMSREDEITAQAAAADVSLAPGEALGERDTETYAFDEREGTSSMPKSVVESFAGGEEADRAFMQAEEQRAAPDDPFDMSDGGGLLDPDNADGMFTDDRDQQGTLDVGMGAGVTEDRSGQIAGSANFADERDDLMPDQDAGEQAGLLEQETNVGGDGQTDLFGGNASETSGAEYRL